MRRKIICLTLSMAMGVSLIPDTFAKDCDRTILYVSASGNDSNDGSEKQPFASLEKARDTLRNMKRNGEIGADGAVVYIREGVYRRDKTFSLTSEDSGTESAPICYRAYPGEDVEFIGGIELSESDFKKLSDEEDIKRLSSSSLASSIVYCDLTQFGIKPVEQILKGAYSYGMYMDKIAGKKPTEKPPEVFVNDVAYDIARYPNEGFLEIQDIVENGGNPSVDYENRKEEDFTPFKIKLVGDAEQHSAKWNDAKEALIFGRFYNEWADQTIPLKSVSNGVMESEWASRYGIKKGGVFYIYNLLEELDVEGEYYIDTEKSRLYIYPPKGKLDVKVSILNDSLFKIDGAENITFKNISMGTTCGYAFEINDNSKNVVFDTGNIRFVQGKAGIFQGKNTKNCGLKNYHIYDTDGGIDMTPGNDETLESANCFIENCDFERFARLTTTYNPAIGVGGVGNHIRHNKIHDALHMGMTGGGVKNDISYNEFYDLLKDTDDAGAVYGGRRYLSRGNVFKYNYFHDLKSETEGSFGVHGIYFDDGFSGAIAVGNVFENVTGSAIFFAGKDNYAANNIFINVGKSTITLSPRSMDGSGTGTDVAGYLLNSLKGIPYKNEYWQKEFPEVYNAETDMFPDINVNNVFIRNLSYKSPAVPGASGKNIANNNYQTDRDPGFYSIKDRNYLLKPDSEVFDRIEGFEPVPFTRMGMYSERAMKRIKKAVALYIDSPYAFVNGKLNQIDSNDAAVVPVIIDNSTYVPLRFVTESLGATVDYDEATKDATIKLGDKTITVNTGTTIAKVDGGDVDMGIKPIIFNSRIQIPLRKVTELLDKKVTWDDGGLISISDTDGLLNSENDSDIISYISGKLSIY